MAELTKYKRLAVFEDTEAQLRILAREKGVSIGVYLQKLIPYVQENGIDYTEADREGDQIKKRIEAGIRIQRAMEKTYFVPLLEMIRSLSENLEMVVSDDLSGNELVQNEINADHFQTESIELHRKVGAYKLVSENMDWLLKQGQERKGKVEFVLTVLEVDRLRKALENVL